MRRLTLAFASPADLAGEFERNIAAGGAQIRSDAPVELREQVEVALEFAWRDETLVLEAEVVFASPDGEVAVQFAKPTEELRRELAPLLGKQSGARATPAPRAAAPRTAAARAPAPRAQAQAPARAAPKSAAPSRKEDFFDLDPGAFDLDDSPPAAPAVPGADTREQTPTPGAPRSEAPRPRASDPLEAVSDRREGPRAAARVPARVWAGHVSLEGLTRDLSETGALISADGSDLPLGKRVRLELQHPRSGRRIEVEGEVTRHVETEGTVAAVGIRFDAHAEQQRTLREFVSDVKRAQAERSASGISGRIEELGMASLVQMLGQSSPSGTLTATRGAEEGTVAFQNGNVRYAMLGSLRGIKALARMLQWPDGEFSFHAQVDAITDEPEPIPLQSALLEAARQVDEAARSAPLEMRARFTVNREAFTTAGELNKTEEAVIDLAAAGLSVRRIIDVIPDADADVQGAIRSLLDREILLVRR